MLRHDMWRGEVPEGMTVPEEIVEMKPGTIDKSIHQEKRARRGRRKPRGEGRRKRKQS